MRLNQKCGSAISMISQLTMLSFVLFGILAGIAYGAVDEDDFGDFKSEPKTLKTDEYKGIVLDAATGKPVEGAVVVYKWDVTVSLIESNTSTAAQYDTLTDNEGKYVIPSQSFEIEYSQLSRLEPEQIIIYKPGYLWWKLDEEQVSSFMVYVPDAIQRYNRKNNVVKLQPWMDEFSHSEHIEIFERDWNYPESQLLEKALEQERQSAAAQDLSELKEVPDIGTKTRKSYGAQSKAVPYNRPGAGIMALGGRGDNPELTAGVQGTPKRIQEERLQRLRSEVSSLIVSYKQGTIAEDQYKLRLQEYLKVADSQVLVTVARALKEVKDYSAVPVLAEYLKNCTYRKWDFERSLSTFIDITGRTDLPESTNVIQERLEIVTDIEQWWQRNKDKNESQWLVDMVANGKTDSAQIAAMMRTAETKDKSAISCILQCLANKGDCALYEGAIMALGEIGDESVTPQIKDKLLHENVYVRRQSALTLNKLGDKSGVGVMIASLDSPSQNTRSIADAVLRTITGQDFTGGKSLRQLPADKQKEAVQGWNRWWQANRGSFDNFDFENISNILKTDDQVLKKRYAAMEAEAQKNPEAPVFDNPDKSPQACFSQFKKALADGDADKAVSFLSPHIRDDYKKIFTQIGPQGCSDFARGFGPIIFESRLDQMFFYEMITETDDGIFSFPVHFVQVDEGRWIIQTL